VCLTSRPLDQFGVGYYFINIANPTIQGPLQTRVFLRDEYGFESLLQFCNHALAKVDA
jgi:hypothetical protein